MAMTDANTNIDFPSSRRPLSSPRSSKGNLAHQNQSSLTPKTIHVPLLQKEIQTQSRAVSTPTVEPPSFNLVPIGSLSLDRSSSMRSCRAYESTPKSQSRSKA